MRALRRHIGGKRTHERCQAWTQGGGASASGGAQREATSVVVWLVRRGLVVCGLNEHSRSSSASFASRCRVCSSCNATRACGWYSRLTKSAEPSVPLPSSPARDERPDEATAGRNVHSCAERDADVTAATGERQTVCASGGARAGDFRMLGGQAGRADAHSRAHGAPRSPAFARRRAAAASRPARAVSPPSTCVRGRRSRWARPDTMQGSSDGRRAEGGSGATDGSAAACRDDWRPIGRANTQPPGAPPGGGARH